MLIDWFTVGAQVLNFLVLVWLLKRFLYKPILDAIDAREKRIAAELADADRKKAEAATERDAFQHKNEAFDRERAGLLAKAVAQAKTERERLVGEARKAAELLAGKRQAALKNEALSLGKSVGLRAREEVFDVARKVLADLSGIGLEQRIGEVFIRQLKEMDGSAKAALAEALKTASRPALVRSAFDLPEAQRASIGDALKETLSTDLQVEFEIAPDLVCGIELSANGHKVAWSVADYLRSLEKSIEQIVQATGGTPQSGPRPKSP